MTDSFSICKTVSAGNDDGENATVSMLDETTTIMQQKQTASHLARCHRRRRIHSAAASSTKVDEVATETDTTGSFAEESSLNAPEDEIAETAIPATESPPATKSPATKSPATESPAKESPATESPATETETEPPVTESDKTESSVTETSVTETSVTETSVTETSVTEAPVTKSPESSVTESSITELSERETPPTATSARETPVTKALETKTLETPVFETVEAQATETPETTAVAKKSIAATQFEGVEIAEEKLTNTNIALQTERRKKLVSKERRKRVGQRRRNQRRVESVRAYSQYLQINVQEVEGMSSSSMPNLMSKRFRHDTGEAEQDEPSQRNSLVPTAVSFDTCDDTDETSSASSSSSSASTASSIASYLSSAVDDAVTSASALWSICHVCDVFRAMLREDDDDKRDDYDVTTATVQPSRSVVGNAGTVDLNPTVTVSVEAAALHIFDNCTISNGKKGDEPRNKIPCYTATGIVCQRNLLKDDETFFNNDYDDGERDGCGPDNVQEGKCITTLVPIPLVATSADDQTNNSSIVKANDSNNNSSLQKKIKVSIRNAIPVPDQLDATDVACVMAYYLPAFQALLCHTGSIQRRKKNRRKSLPVLYQHRRYSRRALIGQKVLVLATGSSVLTLPDILAYIAMSRLTGVAELYLAIPDQYKDGVEALIQRTSSNKATTITVLRSCEAKYWLGPSVYGEIDVLIEDAFPFQFDSVVEALRPPLLNDGTVDSNSNNVKPGGRLVCLQQHQQQCKESRNNQQQQPRCCCWLPQQQQKYRGVSTTKYYKARYQRAQLQLSQVVSSKQQQHHHPNMKKKKRNSSRVQMYNRTSYVVQHYECSCNDIQHLFRLLDSRRLRPCIERIITLSDVVDRKEVLLPPITGAIICEPWKAKYMT